MKTIIKILSLTFLILLYQGCLPDSLEKWEDSSGNDQPIMLIDPPSNLSYAGSPYTYTKDLTIVTIYPTVTAPVGYPVNTYDISPKLDGTGLTFNTFDGSISGKPSDYMANTTFTITAQNTGGTAKTTIQIQVPVVAPTSFSYDKSLYLYSLDTSITGSAPIPTLTPSNVSPCKYEISSDIRNEIGIEFDEDDGTFSGEANSLLVNQLTGTVNVTAAATGPNYTVTGTSTKFTSELVAGAKIIFYDSSGNPQQCSSGICEIASIGSDTSLNLTSAYAGSTAGSESSISAKSLGKLYTIRASTDTSTTLGGYKEASIFIGVNADSLSSFTYEHASYSFPREKTISTIGPPTGIFGNDVVFSIQKGAVTNALKQFKYETGLDFDTTDGSITGTAAPASYLTLTVASVSALTARCSTLEALTLYQCTDPIKFRANTAPTVYGYIRKIDTGSNQLQVAILAPKKIFSLTASDVITDEESLGFSQTITAVGTEATTPNGDNHGYLAGELYTIVATDDLGNQATSSLTISINKTAPSQLRYDGPLSFTLNTAVSPIGPDNLDGDTFGIRYSISPDLNAITGLNFDNQTGEISGTPTSYNIPINYTITAYTETDNDDGITPFDSQTTTSTNVSIGVYQQLSTDMQYTQSRTLLIDVGNLTGGAMPTPTTHSVSSLQTPPGIAAGFTGTVDNVSSDNTQMTITKSTTDNAIIVSVGDIVGFSNGAYVTVVAVTNIYSIGESISLSPSGPSTGTPTSYNISNTNGITWNSATGAITGSMTTDFTKQSYTIYGSNPVSQTNTISFSIAVTTEEPQFLNYSNEIALSVGDTTKFKVGGPISGKDSSNNKAYGTVLKVSEDENLLLVHVNSGQFTDQMSIDNTKEYLSEETTTSNFYILNVTPVAGTLQKETILGATSGALATIRHIDSSTLFVQVTNGTFLNNETITGQTSGATATIDSALNNGIKKDEPAKYNSAIIDVADASDFNIGGYISTSNAGTIDTHSNVGIINYVDDDSEEIYVRIVKGTFTQTQVADTIYYYLPTGFSAGVNSTINSIESSSITVTFSDNGQDGLTVGKDFTTSVPEIGIVHAIDSASDSADIAPTTSGTSRIFIAGAAATGTLYNVNPPGSATAIGDGTNADITKVAHNHAFYLYARESVNIVPTINKGNVDATYSISPTLMPDGLIFSAENGSISGEPTGSFPEQSYTVTATSQVDSSVTATFSFSIKVYDYIELTNHTVGAASYILHKEGQSNNSAPCRILADHLDVDSAPTAMCRLEAGELDLHQQGLTLGANVGAGICNYVRFVPFYYNRYEYKLDEPVTGDLANDSSTYNIYTESGSCNTLCTGTNLSTTSQCPKNWNTYYLETDQTSDYPIDSPSCSADYGTYANCSEGEYVIRTYTCSELPNTEVTGTVDTIVANLEVVGAGTAFSSELAADDYVQIGPGITCGGGNICQVDSVTDNTHFDLKELPDTALTGVEIAIINPCKCVASETTVECTGDELNCKDGPAIGFGNVADRPDMGLTLESAEKGLEASNWSFTAPALQIPYQDTNLSLANYVSSNSCENGTYQYHYYSWLGYSANLNAQDPFQRSSISNAGYVNPYYTLYCLDASRNIKGKILLQVREWDKDFTIADDIDQVVPTSGTKMDNPSYSNYYDWDDFRAPNPSNWTPQSLPTLPTLAAGPLIPGTTSCGATINPLQGGAGTTVTTTANSTLITRDGGTTDFLIDFKPGDALSIAGTTCAGKSYCIVEAITSSTTLYLTHPADSGGGTRAVQILAQPGAAGGALTDTMDTTAGSQIVAASTSNGSFTTELAAGAILYIPGTTCGNGGLCIVEAIVDDDTLYLKEDADSSVANADATLLYIPARLPQNYQ